MEFDAPGLTGELCFEFNGIADYPTEISFEFTDRAGTAAACSATIDVYDVTGAVVETRPTSLSWNTTTLLSFGPYGNKIQKICLSKPCAFEWQEVTIDNLCSDGATGNED